MRKFTINPAKRSGNPSKAIGKEKSGKKRTVDTIFAFDHSVNGRPNKSEAMASHKSPTIMTGR